MGEIDASSLGKDAPDDHDRQRYERQDRNGIPHVAYEPSRGAEPPTSAGHVET